MKFGVFVFPTEYSISPKDLAVSLEARGFESMFVCEHTHNPVRRLTPFPGGEPLPREYSHTLDPFVALATAAAVTDKLRLGTGICLVAQRDPIVTAKEAASLDLVSSGRFELGIGAGWNQDEMENHGTVYETRFKVMTDRVKAIKALWTQEEASYHGQFTQFEPVWSWPKPLQKPNPPVLLGGETRHSLRRVLSFCDGWLPRGNMAMADPHKGMEELRTCAEESERDVGSISVSVFRALPEEDYLNKCREAGVTRVLFQVPSKSKDEVMPLLDQYTSLMGV